MARDGVVRATNGSDIPMRIDTICTHGDTPGSHELTRQLRAGLEAEGITVQAPDLPPARHAMTTPRSPVETGARPVRVVASRARPRDAAR